MEAWKSWIIAARLPELHGCRTEMGLVTWLSVVIGLLFLSDMNNKSFWTLLVWWALRIESLSGGRRRFRDADRDPSIGITTREDNDAR